MLFPARPPESPANPDRRADGRWNSRYDTLDLWRALVAIGIVLHHAGHYDFGINTGRVVLFFVISGYCIAASAESCLRRGMGGWTFFLRRARRIYPPYLLALLFWIGTRLVKYYQRGENDLLVDPIHHVPRTVGDWIKNGTLTQWLTVFSHPVARPGDNPTLFVSAYWSLAYEEQFYLIISAMFGLAILRPWARMRWMIPALVPFAIAYGLMFPQTIRGIFIEFWVAFATGAAVYYRLSVLTDRRWRMAIDATLFAFVGFALAGLQLDSRIGVEIDRSKWHEWLIAGVFALMLIAMRPLDKALNRLKVVVPLRLIGRISYSLFLIHQFNLTLMATISAKLIRLVDHHYVVPVSQGADPIALYPWYDMSMQVVLHIMLAVVFWFFCEYPFLNRSDPGGRSGAMAPPARAAVAASNGVATRDQTAPVRPEAVASHAG